MRPRRRIASALTHLYAGIIQEFLALTAKPDTTRSIAIGLRGGLHAGARPAGGDVFLRRFRRPETLRSFWAAAMVLADVLPARPGLHPAPQHGAGGMAGGGGGLSWWAGAGFALVSPGDGGDGGARRRIGRAFIAAWNWSNIPQYAALVLLSAPGAGPARAGSMPGPRPHRRGLCGVAGMVRDAGGAGHSRAECGDVRPCSTS